MKTYTSNSCSRESFATHNLFRTWLEGTIQDTGQHQADKAETRDGGRHCKLQWVEIVKSLAKMLFAQGMHSLDKPKHDFKAFRLTLTTS